MNIFEILAKWPGIEHEAATIYNDIMKNHPNTPEWNELSESTKEEWIRQAANRQTLNG